MTSATRGRTKGTGRVEAAVARRLPHRSGLAAFPHPALLMSIPVSGRSPSPDVNEPGRRQRVDVQKSVEAIPRQSSLLAAPPQYAMPCFEVLVPEAAKAIAVAGDAEIGVVPAQHASQPSMLLAKSRVHPSFQLELCWNLGDGANQGADIWWVATSIPSRNCTPRTTFGNWFCPCRRRQLFAAAMISLKT